MEREGTSRKHLYICTRICTSECGYECECGCYDVLICVGVCMVGGGYCIFYWKGISVIIMTYLFCGRI